MRRLIVICLLAFSLPILVFGATGFETSPEVGGRSQQVASSPSGAGSDTGLVTCSGPDCDACDLVNMVNKIVNFLIVLLTIAATFALVITGFKMVTSGGNTTAWESAKGTFANIIIGFILVLGAWLIVDTLLLTLTGKSLTLLGTITC